MTNKDSGGGLQLMRRLRFLALLAPLGLSACSDASIKFPVTDSEQKAVSDVMIIKLTGSNIASFAVNRDQVTTAKLPDQNVGEYRIGGGDVISIYVFDHPELALPTSGDAISGGFLVRSDGTLSYPFIGSVTAKGLTVEELRLELARRLAKFFPDPQVDVRIAAFKSQKFVVGGEVNAPNIQSIEGSSPTLLEALNKAGGLTDNADAAAITVRRDKVNYSVDLDGFLYGNSAANNPVLVGGDLVSVPRKVLREAYLLGEVQQPATVDLTNEPISLTQAITRQGGIDEVRADARGIFVFRYVAGKMTVYQLDTSLPTALLLGTKFALAGGDVVYVTKAPIQRWNDTISRLLPTITASNTVKAF